jgi:hypothetical protein
MRALQLAADRHHIPGAKSEDRKCGRSFWRGTSAVVISDRTHHIFASRRLSTLTLLSMAKNRRQRIDTLIDAHVEPPFPKSAVATGHPTRFVLEVRDITST